MSVEDVRAGVLGGNVVPLEKPPRRGRGKPPPQENEDCPVVALGHRAGEFVFLNVVGEERRLSARQLGGRADLMSLFGGRAGWLLKTFPKKDKAGEVIGFQTALASEFLMRLAFDAGLYGPHVLLRNPGVWPDPADALGLVVHCGDAVSVAGAFRPAGFRHGDCIWPSAPATPRPAFAVAEASLARDMQQRMQTLWAWKQPGGAIAALGLVAVGYLGAAARWRSNGFITGSAGSGKSMLLDFLRALSPMHHHTNDTTKAGLEQELNGRAMPSFIDEASDRVDQQGAQRLLDLVLSASGAGGTHGHRGGQNGVGRTVSLISCIVMAAVSPPDMKPQHRQRFTMVELEKPAAGEDALAAMQALTADARTAAPHLWARALAGFGRTVESLGVFRRALGEAGCDAREMDQLGAILAGWWVLTEDGVPDARAAHGGVRALGDLVVGAAATAADDAARQMLRHLATSTVPLNRSTEIEQVAVLVARAFGEEGADEPYYHDGGLIGERPSEAARKLLHRYGMRVVRETDPLADARGRPVPRGGEGDGIWFGEGVRTLRERFTGSAFEGERWLTELRRLPSARRSGGNVRIGGYSQRAVWVSRADWAGGDDG